MSNSRDQDIRIWRYKGGGKTCHHLRHTWVWVGHLCVLQPPTGLPFVGTTYAWYMYADGEVEN